MSDVTPQAESQRSLTGRIIDFCCLGFAAWTVLCNAVVLAEGSLVDLLQLTGLAFLAVVTAWWFGWRGMRSFAAAGRRLDFCEDLKADNSANSGELSLNARAAALIAGILVVLSYPLTGSFVLFWWLFAAYFAVALLVTVKQPIGNQPVAPSRRSELILLCIGVLCAAVTLFAHRPDNDEVFYINLALGAADHPESPLLKYENIHGIPELPLTGYYRVTAIEVLVGATSYLSGVAALAVSHWIVATFAGFMVPLAYGRLFRVIGGRGWLWGVAGAIVFLLVDGSTHANYGNLAFVRLYQGKCIFLSVVAPLIVAYALRFSSRPTVHGWLLLSASLIAGTGLTSSAVWAGPATAALALAVGWRPTRRGAAVLAVGATALFYPLVVGLLLKLGARVSAGQSVTKAVLLDLPEQSYMKVLGDNLAPVTVVMLAWLLIRPALGSRFATIFPLGFACLLNPYTAPWIAQNLTGIRTFWRLFWLLPIPALVGLAVIGCQESLGRVEGNRKSRLIGYVGALALAATLFPSRYTLSPANGVEIKLPALKMPLIYDYVEMVNRSVTPGAYVLAPPEVSQWMTTQSHHAYPLISLYKYLRGRLEPADLERRAALMSYVSGRHRAGMGPETLRRGLRDYDTTGVCLDLRAPWIDEMRSTLAQEHYRKHATQGVYEMWTLKARPSSS